MKMRYYKRILTLALIFVFALIGGISATNAEEINDSSIDTSYGKIVQSGVLNVVVPSNIDFVIDPIEIAGRGQVYSNARPIENRGEYDVLFMITEVNVIFANTGDFVPMFEPFESTLYDAEKKIYLALTLGDATSAITNANVEMEPAVISRLLNAGSRCPISIIGNVNPYSEAEWRDGDVKIQIIYQIETIIDDDAKTNESENIDTDGDEIFEDVPDAAIDAEFAPEEGEQQELTDDGGTFQSEFPDGDGGEDDVGPVEGGTPTGPPETEMTEDPLMPEPPSPEDTETNETTEG
jgi:hypothetical protein